MHNKSLTFVKATTLVMVRSTYYLECVWLEKVMNPMIEI